LLEENESLCVMNLKEGERNANMYTNITVASFFRD